MRYLLLNLVCAAAITAGVLAYTRGRLSKTMLYTIICLLVMTAAFDSLIIMAGIVGYHDQQILGIYIWRAPVEDFMYAIVSVVLVALLWEYYDSKE